MKRNTYVGKAVRSEFSNWFLLSFSVLLLGLPLGRWELMAQGPPDNVGGGNSENSGGNFR